MLPQILYSNNLTRHEAESLINEQSAAVKVRINSASITSHARVLETLGMEAQKDKSDVDMVGLGSQFQKVVIDKVKAAGVVSYGSASISDKPDLC